MNKIIIDDVLREKLDGLHEPTTLCDINGKALAYLTPVTDPSIYAKLDPQISEEELTRREKEGGGRPLSEILSDLKNEN